MIIEELNKKNLRLFYNYLLSFNGIEKHRTGFYPLYYPDKTSFYAFSSNFNKWKKNEYILIVLRLKAKVVAHAMIKNLLKKKNYNSKLKYPSTGIFVKREYREFGFATLLMKYLIAYCKLNKISKVYATLDLKNIPSYKLHKKMGYKKTKTYFNKFYLINKKKYFFRDYQFEKKII